MSLCKNQTNTYQTKKKKKLFALFSPAAPLFPPILPDRLQSNWMGWKLGDACNIPPRIASRPPRETLPQCSYTELLIMHTCTRAGRNTSTAIQWLIQVHVDQHSDKCGEANSLLTRHLEGRTEAGESKSCGIIKPLFCKGAAEQPPSSLA